MHVNVVKPAPACVFAAVNAEFNDLMRPMLYGAHHDIINASHPNGEPHVYTVVGHLCETDTFATDRTLPEVRPQDVLVFKNAGAYGFEMSSQFNAQTRAAEVLIDEGTPRLIRRRETFEDLLRTQVVE